MDDFDKFLQEELKNPDFKKEWDKSEPKYQLISEFIKIRNELKLTQKELAQKIGTTQAVISRFESGSVNPSLDFLKRIAKATNKKLEIKFK